MKADFIPSFAEEKLQWDRGTEYVIGIDEVGRGAFAGPVVVAGVAFSSACFAHYHNKLHELYELLHQIHDSKLLAKKIREKLTPLIKTHCLLHEIAEIPVSIINEKGIGRAAFLGMQTVVKNLQEKITPNNPFILVDGFPIPDISLPQKYIVKGDQKCISIAAAAIIAKVYRDEIMDRLALNYPQYLFEKNKGYGTKAHREAIRTYGLSKLHRTSFDLQQYC